MNDKEIEHIAQGLLSASLPREAWAHAAHFAAALWFLRHRPDEAFAVMPGFIRRYNEISGTPNTDTSGYHKTITQASMRLAAWHLLRSHDAVLSGILDNIMRSPAARSDWLQEYWSRERLFSAEARRSWIEPDLKLFPYTNF